MPQESQFLQWIRAQQRADSRIKINTGDDLAALDWRSDDLLLVGIDQVLEGVHFDSTVHAPKQIGAKAMNRNLSDCAAMACLPVAAVVSVALPRGSSMEFAQELYRGLREAADAFDCAIVGGDTSAWAGKLAMSVAIIGKSAGVQPLTRSGARAGDAIFVTGALGGSILGRHLTFTPRIAPARQLAQTGKITSMIDISDGLSRDLNRICEASNVGAVLDADKIPVHEDAKILAKQDGRSPLDHALNDGEDHELLFTAASDLQHDQCIRIGEIITFDTAPRIWLNRAGAREAMTIGGWDARW